MKTNKTLPVLGILVGITISMGALWGASYLSCHGADWMNFPSVMTGVLMGVGGLALTVVSAGACKEQ